ncbi:4'-phosphopantetheinyl transferase family protein [Streptomyces sp. NPDC059002]|uniref:4'-phosphopantetheinyl transferase family protein n=1 Tax=Streptomyces sp. NPDC059002 TaxID=3346690 RepID=UPI0036781BBA
MSASPPAAARVVVVVAPTSHLSDAEARGAVLGRAAAVLRVPPGDLRVDHDDQGRPRLSGAGRGMHISLSHGRGVAAVAMTRAGPVGVDVETVRPLPALRLARRWFTPEEAAWLRALPERRRPAAYFWLWTHKEAMGKALGTGLAQGGLSRPAPLPDHWPPPSGTRLLPCGAAGSEALAVAAPRVAPHLQLAVAAAGMGCSGAPVDLYPRVAAAGPEAPLDTPTYTCQF